MEGIRCPYPCPQLYSPQEIEDLCSGDLFRKYLKFLECNRVVKDKNLKWCSAPNCEKVIKKGKSNRVTCECGFEMCFQCGEAWHGGTSCEKVVDALYQKYAKEKNVKLCPRCRVRIEKNEGCKSSITQATT